MSQNIEITEQIDQIRVYVKLVLTTQTKYYNINLNWTITEFLEYIKTKAMDDFLINNVDANTFNASSQETKLEYVVVEAGQRIEGIQDENAPELQNSDAILSNLYGNMSQCAFYVRPVYVIL